MENRRKPAPPAATLDINCDCKEYVIDYLAKSFPVRLMAVFTDENGNPRSEPMSDEHGVPVLCRSALAARDRMIEQLCALPPIATALDAIIERFGVEQVAEAALPEGGERDLQPGEGAALDALHGALRDARRVGQLCLGDLTGEPQRRQPLAQLRDHGVVLQDLLDLLHGLAAGVPGGVGRRLDAAARH